MPSTLTLASTLFNKAQLDRELTRLDAEGLCQLAFAGRSNVGKSSLINALAGRKNLAKTSATPGKTRSINVYHVAPENFCLVDLPGYGYARCSQSEREAWARLIERYLTDSAGLRGLVLLLDCRLDPQTLDRELAAFALARRIPLLPLLTKADKCTQAERAARARSWAPFLEGQLPLPVSAARRLGLDELWQTLRAFVAPPPQRPEPAAG